MQIPMCPFPTTTKVCSLLTGSFTGGGAGSPMSNPYLLSNLSEIQPRRGRQLTRESDHCGDSCSERAPEKKTACVHVHGFRGQFLPVGGKSTCNSAPKRATVPKDVRRRHLEAVVKRCDSGLIRVRFKSDSMLAAAIRGCCRTQSVGE